MLRIFTMFFFGLATLCNVVQCKGQNQPQDFSKLYKVGGTLYICAVDGLALNDKPGMNGTKVKLVPYGSAVLVQKDNNKQVTNTTDNIAGHWVKVKSDSIVGFIFDGYLSRWLPVGEREACKSYLDKVSRIRTTDKKAPQISVKDYEKIIYENGAMFESRIFETGSTTSVIIAQTGITVQEAWLLALALFPNYRNTICKYDPAGVTCSDGSARTLNVKKEGKNVIISEEVKE